MAKLALYEIKCADERCGKISLQKLKKEYENLYPYCGEETFYTPGKIAPVVFYISRSEIN